MRNRLVYSFLLILSLYLIVSLTRSIWLFWQKRDVLKQAEIQVNQEMKKNQELTQQLSQVRTQEFIEQQARDKLNLSKPQETVVVVPPELVSHLATYSGLISGQKEEEPNWKKWVKLFF